MRKVGLILIGLMSLGSPGLTGAASTSLTQQLDSGVLNISSPPSGSLSGATIDVMREQISTGTLGDVAVTDSRGSGAGWSATASISDFVQTGTPKRLAGSNEIALTGNYTGEGEGLIYITIVSEGDLGAATYTVNGLVNRSEATTSATPITFSGLELKFMPGRYYAGDSWRLRIDRIPASNFSITPSLVSTLYGLPSGVSAGNTHRFTSPSDVTTLMVASAGSGLGRYATSPAISLVIPPNARSGRYAATLTETVN